jgi:Rieske Fe-S protein
MLDQAAELSYSRQDATIKQAINTLKANLAEVQTHSAQQINALANASLKPSQASQYKLPPVEVNRIADQVYNTLERKLRTEKERRGR